jgi:nitrogen-specific signal transduction histidine kinase
LAPIEVVPQDMMRVFLRSHRQRTLERATLATPSRTGCGTTGIGISVEHREKLFQPFFTTKPPGEGTGLGGSVSCEIVVLQHGGMIKVESEVGDFAKFIVQLPRYRHSAAGKAA